MSLFSNILSSSPTTEINSSQSMPENGRDGSAYLSTLSNGQTITGKIVALNSNQVTIDLGNGSYVNAKLDSAMDLSKGQYVSFEVKTGSNQQVTLSPLYTNLTQDATASKALLAANMVVTGDTVAMTSAMMDAGMSIDRNSLGDMYHLINSHSEADPKQIVEMTKLGLEVNKQSIGQFEAFSNYENQITSGIHTIIDKMPNAHLELVTGNHPEEAMQFMKELTEILSKDLPGDVNLTDQQVDMKELLTEMKQFLEMEFSCNLDGDKSSGDLRSNLVQDGKNIIGENAFPESKELNLSKIVSNEEIVNAEITNTEITNTDNQLGKISLSNQQILEQTPEQVQVKDTLMQILKDMGAPREMIQKIDTQPMNGQALLELTNTLLELESKLPSEQRGMLRTELNKVFSQESFTELLKQSMRDNWLIHPEEVGKKQNIENLYQRLNTQSRALTSLISQLPISQTTVSSNLSQMNQTLDFMNQMNQMAAYIQIPLKMSGQDTTGDLYVYTNKKNLAAKDGNVSAMLHLDMQHLGTVDVYATMSEGKNVSTKFYLANEEMLDFIGSNIHILNERLKKRGYHVNSEMSLNNQLPKETRQEPIQNTTTQKTLYKQSFDMRA